MLDKIIINGAREHNLKDIDLEIPKYKLVVFTGLSGSGKSSLAFDTIYAEGQRRYVESLSSYARQFLGIMKKPDVDFIEGLSPSISIDQKSTSHNPRSTVGTVTEVYDYLRLLFARIGHPHCPNDGTEISRTTKEKIVEDIIQKFASAAPTRIMILAPIVKGRKGEYVDLFRDLKKRGYQRVRIDGQIFGLDEDLVLIKTNKHTIEAVVDRLTLDPGLTKQRLIDSVEQALNLANRELTIAEIKDKGFSIPDKPKNMEDTFYSEKFACPLCGTSMLEIEPRLFSFNSPYGACPDCNGLGVIQSIDEDRVLNPYLSILEGGILAFPDIDSDTWFGRTVQKAFENNNIPLNVEVRRLMPEQKRLILNGTSDQIYEVKGTNRFGERTKIYETYPGVTAYLLQKYNESGSELVKREIEKFMTTLDCDSCHGARLKKEALSVTISGISIVELSDLSIEKSYDFIAKLFDSLNEREKQIARIILREIQTRMKFLIDVGLSYLTLSRNAQTLAGGEAQRIRLASQIGSGLSGVLYVLDEPSIGLHPRDNSKLINTLKKLRDLGNSVIVVEHDREMMNSCDYIFDIGPGAGESGGKIVAEGTPREIMKNKASLTGEYLSKKKEIINRRRGFDVKKIENFLELNGISAHNLKNINVKLPQGAFICVTGVSGSGKSTLINDVLYHVIALRKNPFHKEKPGEFREVLGDENLKRVFLIDQSPIGRTPRSNPATYTGAFTYIREIFSNTREARMRGYGPGRFSFNVRGGRCETCEGEGQIKIEMQFLPDVYVTCETCNGSRYTESTLEIGFEGKNISEVLSMSVDEALDFFSFHEGLFGKLVTLKEVGLSYIKLGQSATTLSGGEAQRIKLATELSKKGGGGSLYLLDEPTTGLHFADLEKLISVLRKLVEKGNTVIVIEHNLDVIKNADWIIDLGPEGGDAGGEIVAEGTPEEITKNPKSYTGQYLAKEL
ncbi:MAG: excinuclease ABC subunit A [Candidatus Levybacteria bacterium RIFCSPHIGHO2_02_FULL_40_18]|nr:MAG: excinuclease ABC subunit A [Candidatus Levybacteria bacterium RIFCSPHIGHO2_01_FULL_40_58]OGH27303.1 MAG: excinuclease ABC subunit A [Candidatus Levybacteria bacterium RIFCSPHIGHO2_02_FULL_40_18]OGH30930.1 MAG: excinuclease ABC subunit A [Candidatus Levybacteria bacterium RIFCSPHIGHO2_12_FULL_40_31]OGH40941.1 MAG: excinuclease ABC subunit A [Candidatus Levybacteria bacterium RIFCSPLOWO2_01_FULL_40_64]OGH48982.1 MAG: excinuclease ABC subunit A [Candidatus Levybacteria bacterium RIFCSPLOWO